VKSVKLLDASTVDATPVPRSLSTWKASLQESGTAAVIAIAGSRGKTTVVRLVNAILRDAGYRTALWTDNGVEINDRRQQGELVPWSRALARLTAGTLDVAIQELDWATVHAVGLPGAVYPIVAVTNLCGNNDSCMTQLETIRAAKSLDRVLAAVRPDGRLILNGEDFAVAAAQRPPAATTLVSLSQESPLLRSHLRHGGIAGWLDREQLMIGDVSRGDSVGQTSKLRLTQSGAVGFQVHNALMAASIARACGTPLSAISRGLRRFDPSLRRMPGSFNVVAVGDATVIVDRPAPSWFLRTALRAVAHLGARRLLTIVGRMEAVPEDDLVETGRLLGRNGGAIILHSAEVESRRHTLFRQGLLANDVPPVVVSTVTERQAVNRALAMLRPDDIVLVLADQPAAVIRLLERARS